MAQDNLRMFKNL